MKRILSVFLSIVLAFACFAAVPVFAADETPIERIDFDTLTLIENADGFYNYDIHGERYFNYELVNSQGYAIHFKDGSSILGDLNYNGFTYNGELYTFYVEDTQFFGEHYTAGDTVQVPVSVLGYSTYFTVKIVESPVESIDPIEINITENSGGYTYTLGDDTFYIYQPSVNSFTVHYKNGSVQNNVWSVNANGRTYYSNFPFADENQLAEHWTVGNTYYEKLFVAGVSTTVKINIVPSPIKSIEIEDVTFIENSNGSYVYDYNTDTTYFYYEMPLFNYKVTTNDGEVYKGYGNSLYIDDVFYNFTLDDRQYENHWYAGNTYKVDVGLAGTYGTVNISIIENPFDRIEFDPVTIGYNSGYSSFDNLGQEYFHYTYGAYGFTLYYKDSTKEPLRVNDTYLDYLGMQYYLKFNDDQVSSHWQPGNTYNVTATLAGTQGTLSVKIKASQVVDVKFEDISIIEYTGGYYATGYEEYYCYHINDVPFTATLSDGSTVSGTFGFDYNDTYYYVTTYSDQDTEHWTAGNTYTATAELGGITGSFNVTIKKSPVVDITSPDIEYILGLSSDSVLYNKAFTVTLDSGETVECNGYLVYEGNEYYIDNVTFDVPMYEWQAGNTYTATARFMGKSFTYKIHVVESPYTYIEISGTHELVIKLYKPNGSYDTANAVSFNVYGMGQGERGGSLETDIGTFEINFMFSEPNNGLPAYDKNVSIRLGNMVSNTLENCMWFKVQISVTEYVLKAMLMHTISNFKGMTLDNYNEADIVDFAIGRYYRDDFEEVTIDGEYYVRVNRSLMQELIETTFNIKDFDFTKTAHYDPENPDIIYGKLSSFGGIAFSTDMDISYKNGKYTVLYEIPSNWLDKGEEKYDTVKITADEQFRIESIEFINNSDTPYVRGDVNGDGEVNDQDAIYLLFNTIFGDAVYPLNQDGDFNKDGSVNDKDAIYLLFHTLFKELYPI